MIQEFDARKLLLTRWRNQEVLIEIALSPNRKLMSPPIVWKYEIL